MQDPIAGKIVLMTGATDGLGRAAALELARRGARLHLLARDPAKGAALLTAIQAVNPAAEPTLISADLARLADVRAAVDRFRAGHDRLDLLINNAGAVFTERRLSADGFEMTFAVNHLAHFLLSTLVLDLLQATPGARVVSTASAAYDSATLDLDRIATAEGEYRTFSAYSSSKLCNVLFTAEFQRRAGEGVAVSCFHPGFVATNIGANNRGWLARIWTTVGSVIARSPERGADTLLWLASSPEAAHPDGGYFVDRARRALEPYAADPQRAAELWALSERLCGGTSAASAN